MYLLCSFSPTISVIASADTPIFAAASRASDWSDQQQLPTGMRVSPPEKKYPFAKLCGWCSDIQGCARIWSSVSRSETLQTRILEMRSAAAGETYLGILNWQERILLYSTVLLSSSNGRYPQSIAKSVMPLLQMSTVIGS